MLSAEQPWSLRTAATAVTAAKRELQAEGAAQSGERHFLSAGWTQRLQASDRTIALGFGSDWLVIDLPDGALEGVAFERVGDVAGAPRLAVRYGEVPDGAGWRQLDPLGRTFGGRGFELDLDASQVTIDGHLRSERGALYLAIVDAATAWCAASCYERGGLLLHAAVFGFGSKQEQGATVVAGASHAGKTTLSLRLQDSVWSEEHAFLVPSTGGNYDVLSVRERRSFGVGVPLRAKLRRLAVLGPDRSKTSWTALTPTDAVAALWPAVLCPQGGQPLALQALVALCDLIPVGRLAHSLATPNAEVAGCIDGWAP